MDIQQLITQYNKAIEQDNKLEGQYQVIAAQLQKTLSDLGMSYEEAVERGEQLQKTLKESIPKIHSYIKYVEDKQQNATGILV